MIMNFLQAEKIEFKVMKILLLMNYYLQVFMKMILSQNEQKFLKSGGLMMKGKNIVITLMHMLRV